MKQTADLNMEAYKLITGLKIKHEYWNVTSPKLFNITFSAETQALLKKLKILCRHDGNTLHFLGNQRASEYLSSQKERTAFVILLTLTDSNLVNYTDMIQSGDKEVLYFDNSTGVSELNEAVKLLPILRSLAAVYERSKGAKLSYADGRNVLDDLLIAPTHPSFGRALNALDQGLYVSDAPEIGTFYYQPKLIKDLFAAVHLDTTHFNDSEMFQLSLKSRPVRLAYRVKSKQFDLEKLRVLDVDGQINFEGSFVEEERFFVSDSPVKLSQKSSYNFQLLNGTKKPIREHMSLGTTSNFKRFGQDDNQYLNEILINI